MSNYFINQNIQNTFNSLDPRLNYNLNQANNKDSLLHFAESQNFDLTVPLKEIVDQKSDDELFIETWLSKIGKIQINLDSTVNIIKRESTTVKEKKLKSIKISSVKNNLKKSLEILKKLEETEIELKTNVETMSSNEWKLKTIEIGKLKNEFTLLMSQFDSTASINQIKSLISKRAKKRLSRKRNKVNKRLKRDLKREENKRIHKEIDDWLEGMKDAVERVKSEENMKKDADCVLAEVTKKKSDSRKQLSLISALIKLRNVRESISNQRGEKISLEDKSAFNIVTEKLTNMWEDVSKVYMKEEQGLKIMLEKNTNSEGFKKDRMIQEWEGCIFGDKFVPNQAYYGLTSAEKNMETFIAIRKSWDTFLVNKRPNESIEGSKIPIGWVLPSENALETWRKYLHTI